MKKTILSAMVIATVAITSCNKNPMNPTTGLLNFSSEDADIIVSSSNYEKEEIEEIKRVSEHGEVESGILEYTENGQLVARVDFSEEPGMMTKIDKYGEKEHKDCHKKGEKHRKIVVEPIVKSEDCDCIVAGVLEFVDENDEWVATIDFGDGECDKVATKTTAEGTYEVDACRKPKHGKGHPKHGKGKPDFEKKVVEDVVIGAECGCPVSGVVQFYDKDESLVATIDFGDGTCDGSAIKTDAKDGTVTEFDPCEEKPFGPKK